ncbi:MAG: hypothetical protein H7A37_08045, partial [Chlamydiales bacterium]|nr:hypothetical protein [Chlamydiales bacterium]
MNPVNFSSSQSFNVACLSLVRDMEKPFLDFAKIVVKELVHLPERTYLVVLPEYCWRLTPWEDLQP